MVVSVFRRFGSLLLLGLLFSLLSGCAQSVDWTASMNEVMQDYGASSPQALRPYFRRAHVPYPPEALGILVFKRSKRLELYAKNAAGRWVFIRRYRVLAASGTLGPKLHVGDHQVPEGIYQIVGLNPESRFDLSMKLDYPNDDDRHYAEIFGRDHLGTNIYIHGDRRSVGCVAIGNRAIEQLFPLVYRVGINNVTVIIAPNDLRRQKPIYLRGHPKWLPALYAKIKTALAAFPEP